MSDNPIKITPEIIIRAYSNGFFPMAPSGDSALIEWVKPRVRGILPLKEFHIPKSLVKDLKKTNFEFKINHNFEEVVTQCAVTKTGREDTWINNEISELYCTLNEMGIAHSVETYIDNQLVGGLYGLVLGSAFFGESMFSTQTNASKAALVVLVAQLLKQNFTLLDAQFPNEHLIQFGCYEMNETDYDECLEKAISNDVHFYSEASSVSSESLSSLLSEFLQPKTHTS